MDPNCQYDRYHLGLHWQVCNRMFFSFFQTNIFFLFLQVPIMLLRRYACHNQQHCSSDKSRDLDNDTWSCMRHACQWLRRGASIGHSNSQQERKDIRPKRSRGCLLGHKLSLLERVCHSTLSRGRFTCFTCFHFFLPRSPTNSVNARHPFYLLDLLYSRSIYSI